MDVLIATNNEGKRERYVRLLTHAGLPIALHTPKEIGVPVVTVSEDGVTLAENAEQKARAYYGMTPLPILANDAGLWTETEGFVDAPKRTALNGADEHALSEAELAARLTEFWQQKACANGGTLAIEWRDAFVLLLPDDSMKTAMAVREAILTDTVHGKVHTHLPIRALYLSKATGKPAALHTREEELYEMQPIVEAFTQLFDS